MIFEKALIPDYYFETYPEASAEFLKSIGVKFVISDIDNTLVPYEIPDATEEIKSWVASLHENGIKIAFVSNNHEDRVARFNKSLGCPAYWDVGKPSTKYLKLAMAELGGNTENTVFLGDQLLTDSLAAHRMGIRMIAVPPIKDKTNLFFKSKRLIEKPYMKKFFKMRGTK